MNTRRRQTFLLRFSSRLPIQAHVAPADSCAHVSRNLLGMFAAAARAEARLSVLRKSSISSSTLLKSQHVSSERLSTGICFQGCSTSNDFSRSCVHQYPRRTQQALFDELLTLARPDLQWLLPPREKTAQRRCLKVSFTPLLLLVERTPCIMFSHGILTISRLC